MTAGDEKKGREARRAICERCPHLVRGLVKTCGLCRCPIVTKTYSAGECPLRKW